MKWTWLVCVLGLVACSSKPAEDCGPGSAAGSGSAELHPRDIPPDVTRVQSAVGAKLDAVGDGADVVAVPTGIMVEGKMIVPIVNGAVDAAEKEGNSIGLVIPRLSAMLQAVGELADAMPDYDRRRTNEPFSIFVDPRVTYDVLHLILASVKRVDGRSTLVLRSGGDLAVLPVDISTEGDSRSLLVRVSASEVVVAAGGTPERRLALDASTPVALAKELSTIPSGALGLSVVVEFVPSTSVQTVAELLVAMRPHTTHILLARAD